MKVETLIWRKEKPSVPGEYMIRWNDGSNVNKVIVSRRGRGFQVFCPKYNETVPMSRIDDGELEWAKIED